MIFRIHDEDLKEYGEWIKNHRKECQLDRLTAIGGALTYSFTPTGLGTITTIKCGCGEELDLSHVEDW
jgi:hypothetical protein